VSPIKTTKGAEFCYRIPPRDDPSADSIIVSKALTERRVRFESSSQIYPSPPISCHKAGNATRLKRVEYRELSREKLEMTPVASKALNEFEKNKYQSKIFLLQSEIEELKVQLGKARARNIFLEKRVEALTDIIKSS
jgi:hypothetical protein